MNIVRVLKNQRDKLAKQVAGIEAAIAALRGGRWKRKRRMSAAARRKISATQKANGYWVQSGSDFPNLMNFTGSITFYYQ